MLTDGEIEKEQESKRQVNAMARDIFSQRARDRKNMLGEGRDGMVEIAGVYLFLCVLFSFFYFFWFKRNERKKIRHKE